MNFVYLSVLAAALAFSANAQELFPDGDLDQVGAWSVFPFDADAEHTTELGATKKGCLYISNEEFGSDKLKMWMHGIEFEEGKYERLRLSCQVRTEDLEKDTSVQLMAQVIVGNAPDGRVAFPRTQYFTQDTDWTATDVVFDVHPDAIRVRLLFFVSGPGRAWLDDVSITETEDPLTTPPATPAVQQRRSQGRFETLARGAAGAIPWHFDGDAAREQAAEEEKPVLAYIRCTDAKDGVAAMSASLEAVEVSLAEDGMLKDVIFRAGPISTPRIAEYVAEHFVPVCLSYGLAQNNGPSGDSSELGGFPINASRVTTPALVVISADGQSVATLDRMGSLSDDFIAGWLMSALRLTDEGGKAPKIARPHAKVRGARKLAAEGKWKKAMEASDRAIRSVGGEAQFLKGLCLQRLGRYEEADETWESLATESLETGTPWGRKAAACLLPAGPRLHEALTLRTMPLGDEIPKSTETPGADFSPTRSLTALMELQRADGSFGSHTGSLGQGWNDPAITALAVDAMRAWESRMPKTVHKRIPPAVERSLDFLRAYARTSPRASTRSGAFVNPYVLRTLLREKEKRSAQELVAHVQASQDEDGNWSVYGEHRPASFNTAQNLIALLDAKEACLEVSEETLESGIAALRAMLSDDSLFPYSTGAGHSWMTTLHGSIGRDPLCEHALLLGGVGSQERLHEALVRYMRFGEELRNPTKRLYDYFNSRGHGGYFFFFAHHRALEAAAAFASKETHERVLAFVQKEVLAAQEGDGTFIDHYNMGRAYGTAQALLLLAASSRE